MTYRERLERLIRQACENCGAPADRIGLMERGTRFRDRLDAFERDYPPFDKIVEAARATFQLPENKHTVLQFKIGRAGRGEVRSYQPDSRSLFWPASDTPGKAVLAALEAELARRTPKEAEPTEQVDSEPTEELRKLREENRQLREIAEFHDAWQTRDGAWVHRDDYVYRPATEERAVKIPVEERGEWYSKPEAAKAAIGKEDS